MGIKTHVKQIVFTIIISQTILNYFKCLFDFDSFIIWGNICITHIYGKSTFLSYGSHISILLHLYNKWLNNVVHDIHFPHTSLHFSFFYYYYYTRFCIAKLFEGGRMKAKTWVRYKIPQNRLIKFDLCFFFSFFELFFLFRRSVTKLRFLL